MGEYELKGEILKELLNISVGKAADMLSDIVNKKIILNVPNVKFIDKEDAETKLKEEIPEVLNGTLMSSGIFFEESLIGRTNLIFPAEKMRNFINLCMNKESSSCKMNFTDVDFDIIKEVGNIILNCIVGKIGSFLNVELTYALPEVEAFKRIDFSKNIESDWENHILLLYISFVIDDEEIEEAIIINLTFSLLDELMKKANELEDGAYE